MAGNRQRMPMKRQTMPLPIAKESEKTTMVARKKTNLVVQNQKQGI
jgi:hypothetical protein